MNEAWMKKARAEIEKAIVDHVAGGNLERCTLIAAKAIAALDVKMTPVSRCTKATGCDCVSVCKFAIPVFPPL